MFKKLSIYDFYVYRAKLQKQKTPIEKPPSQSTEDINKPMTRKACLAQEEQRKKWRENKAKERASWSAQKRRRYREQEAERRRKKRSQTTNTSEKYYIV